MLRFSEEIMLLLLDEKGGGFVDVPTLSVEYALAASVLMDLAMEGRIDTDPKRLFVVDPTPTGDELLDPTLAAIVQSETHHDCAHWLGQVVSTAAELHEKSLARLVERGILRREEGLFMWVVPTRRFPIEEDEPVREVKLRIMNVLFSEEIPDARDIIIISLADVCRIFERLLSPRELKFVGERIAQVRKLDLIGREVTKAVQEIEASLAMTFAMMR